MAGNTYSVTHQTAAGADLGIIAITGDGSIQIAMYDLILGSDATPADLAGEFVLNRCTTDGVGGTALTPEPLNPAAVAATGTGFGGVFGTTEPVDTANSELLMIPLNQRATFRWVAAPGSELLSVITNNAGLFLRSVAHGGTPNINATALYTE